MKSNFLRNRIGGALLALSLLLGVGIATSVTAQAQYQNDQYSREQRRRQRDYEREQRRRQRDNDRQQRRRDRNYGNNGYYGNDGYYGNNGGYDNRYSDGYGNYGGSNELRQTALNEGFNAGLKAGREDRNRGERYDYQDEGDFQKGTKSYSSRLGNKAIYQQYFREAFSHGYADGYEGN